VVIHYGSVSEQATVRKLVSLLHKTTGEVVKARPRVLTGNCSAVVEVAVVKPVPLELYRANRELGRFMLRAGGHTIAAGMVTDIL
jgi:elongation factor 1 alpha-like protein